MWERTQWTVIILFWRFQSFFSLYLLLILPYRCSIINQVNVDDFRSVSFPLTESPDKSHLKFVKIYEYLTANLVSFFIGNQLHVLGFDGFADHTIGSRENVHYRFFFVAKNTILLHFFSFFIFHVQCPLYKSGNEILRCN